jgi:hypothetical protein
VSDPEAVFSASRTDENIAIGSKNTGIQRKIRDR